MTYKTDFNRKYKFKPLSTPHSLKEISDITGYELKGLKTIFKKGQGAYVSAPYSVRPQVRSADEWAMARVYASINPKSKSYKIDKVHLVKKSKKK